MCISISGGVGIEWVCYQGGYPVHNFTRPTGLPWTALQTSLLIESLGKVILKKKQIHPFPPNALLRRQSQTVQDFAFSFVVQVKDIQVSKGRQIKLLHWDKNYGNFFLIC